MTDLTDLIQDTVQTFYKLAGGDYSLAREMFLECFGEDFVQGEIARLSESKEMAEGEAEVFVRRYIRRTSDLLLTLSKGQSNE